MTAPAETWTWKLPDEAATERLGRWLGAAAQAGDVVTLQGDLGAGKTTLARGMARALGIDEPVTSPTFTLVNEYRGTRLGFNHFDLYRLAPAELEASGLAERWELGRVVCAIEWPERLDGQPTWLVPEAWLALSLVPTPDGGRLATLAPVGARPAAWLAAIRSAAAC